MPRITLIEDLTTGPIPAGSNILVEFDAASQWRNASLTIVAEWLRTGGTINYNVWAEPPDNIRSYLNRYGLNTEELENEDRLRIYDYYTATLGQKSNEEHGMNSLKVADLSIEHSKFTKATVLGPDRLRIMDNVSVLARYNEEKAWVDFLLTRFFPRGPMWKSTAIVSVIGKFHSDWAYKALEAAADGIVDFKLEESGEETRDLIQIRSMRNVGYDRRWHQLRIGDNFEVTLEK